MSSRIRTLPSEKERLQRFLHGLLGMKARLSVDPLIEGEPGHREILVGKPKPESWLGGAHG